MSIKIDCRMGFFGGPGLAAIIDKRLPAKYKKDFDNLQEALDEFLELAHKLVAREDRADRVAETIRKCKGEWACCIR